MLPSAQEVYSQIVCTLSPTERLRLATLILNELVEQDSSVIDQSDCWTEQDQIDLTNFSLQYAAAVLSEDEDPAQ
jgi:ribose 5-phosphate isomerase RpiB